MQAQQKKILFALGLPTIYALVMHLLFSTRNDSDLWQIMTIAFLFCFPIIIGILTVYLLPIEKAKRYVYQVFMPWLPIFFFLVITLFFEMEGWACWLMILPIFLIAASAGGLLSGYWLKRKHNKLRLSILVLLPFMIAPIEHFVGSIPAQYRAYSSIDIHAPADIIWGHVTRVQTIAETDDTGTLNRLLGFPRPVKAELNYEGVGAYRKAVFTKGLVFHETVTAYHNQQKMVFDIKAYPHEIPSTTLDEHVVIGGNYFDVLQGTYELESLNDGSYRLHLYSDFEMNTTFNFYAGLWGKWIMQDIQDNILRIEKQRAEDDAQQQ